MNDRIIPTQPNRCNINKDPLWGCKITTNRIKIISPRHPLTITTTAITEALAIQSATTINRIGAIIKVKILKIGITRVSRGFRPNLKIIHLITVAKKPLRFGMVCFEFF